MEYYNQMSNSWYFNPIICTNPCAEQGLPAWGVCNLSAINLSKFYDDAKHDVDWQQLAIVTRWSVRFLDNVIDKTPYHFEENERNQKRERRVGLGTMGLAELMIKLQIRYGSPESLEFLDKLYGFIARESYLASTEIAAEKGSFPEFIAEKYLQSGFMRNMTEIFPEVGEAVRKRGMRNVTVITQAPTGSTGTMVGTSTGIEPYFAFEYFRQSRLGYDKQYVPIAQAWKDAHPGEELPDYFVTAMDLSAEDHIRVQAAIQRWVDSSISKTANCPNDFTIEETKRLYELAFELGCKGVTIYRDGSRDVQVLTAKKDEAKEPGTEVDSSQIGENATEDESDFTQADAKREALPRTTQSAAGSMKERPKSAGMHELFGKAPDDSSVGYTTYMPVANQAGSSAPESVASKPVPAVIDKAYRRRPQVLRGATYKLNTPLGMAYITINDLNGSPCEIFLNVGKAGSDVFAMSEALGRVCSLFLRYGDHGNKVELLIKHLKGIGGTGAIGFGANRVDSIADAVAKALELHTQGGGEQAAALEAPAPYGAERTSLPQAGGGLIAGDDPMTGRGMGVDAPSADGGLAVSSGPAAHSGRQGAASSLDLCPACGTASLLNVEGCRTCASCGYSRCT
jgi:ribonucleoside-diphosphate reductase alpha chain